MLNNFLNILIDEGKFSAELFLFIEFTLEAERKECVSTGIYGGQFYDVGDCYLECKDTSTIFLFGRSDGACDGDGKCYCNCEVGASKDGTCAYKDHHEYNLYRVSGEFHTMWIVKLC